MASVPSSMWERKSPLAQEEIAGTGDFPSIRGSSLLSESEAHSRKKGKGEGEPFHSEGSGGGRELREDFHGEEGGGVRLHGPEQSALTGRNPMIKTSSPMGRHEGTGRLRYMLASPLRGDSFFFS